MSAAIVFAKERGAAIAELIDYKTSGDSPHAPRDRVVGYAGILIR